MRLVKNPRRDSQAVGFGTWTLVRVWPKGQCADPKRGHHNDRFEAPLLANVPFREVLDKLGCSKIIEPELIDDRPKLKSPELF
jgi:hypothetical protein